MTQTFLAEIKQVKATKTASSDLEFVLTVVTNEREILDLGKLPAKTVCRVTVEDVPDQNPMPSFTYE